MGAIFATIYVNLVIIRRSRKMRKLLYAGIILSFSFLLIAAGCQVTQQPPTTAPALSQGEVISSTAQFTRTMFQLDASAIKWAKAKKVSGIVGVGVQTTGIHAMTTTEVHGWTRTTEESTTLAGTYTADYYYQETKDFNGNITDIKLYGVVILDTAATSSSSIRGSSHGHVLPSSGSVLVMGENVTTPHPQPPTSSDPPTGVNPIRIQYTYDSSNKLSTWSISGYVSFKVIDRPNNKQILYVVTNLNISGEGDNWMPKNGTWDITVTTTTTDSNGQPQSSSSQALNLKFEDGKSSFKYDGFPWIDLTQIIKWFVPGSEIKVTVNPPMNFVTWFPPLGQIDGTATLWIYAMEPGNSGNYVFDASTAVTHQTITGNDPVTFTFNSIKEVWVFAVVFDGSHPNADFDPMNDHGFAGEYDDSQFAPMGMGSPIGVTGPKTISIYTNVQF